MTWRRRCALCCWAIWLAMRLEYSTSLCRLNTSAIVLGSGPDGFHMWTEKISESLRGMSSNTASVGVFERIPPSQYNSPSTRTAGNAGGSAPDAMMCLTPNLQSAAVEISHLAGSQMSGAHRQARPAVVHQIEIDE